MANRIVPLCYATDPRAGRTFFTRVLGLNPAMELDFITTYVDPAHPTAQISVLSVDPSGLRPDYSVGVADVDECHRRALAEGCEIIYPLTNEPWGVRRFFVRDPTGAVANVVAHTAPTETST